MKKVLACLMIACSLLAFGCSGRNAAFGVVDIKKVEAEAPAVKTIKEDLQKKAKELQDQMQKETAGKSREEAEKIVQDKSAQMQVASSEAQSKLKASLEVCNHLGNHIFVSPIAGGFSSVRFFHFKRVITACSI